MPKFVWVVFRYWEGEAELKCNYQAALLFNGWLIIQMMGYRTRFVKVGKFKILYMSKDQGISFLCMEFPKTGGLKFRN